MAPTIYQLGHAPIKDHCFLPDGSVLAVTKGTAVEIYQVGAKPQLLATLQGHDKTVTSVDIAPDGSKILTCSQDRNATVWSKDGSGSYKPTLVLLRITRAATVCRWLPLGRKFAVGSADRAVAVCYYEEENDWWISKHLKKPLRSTITSLSWHPNDVLLACGSTDGHARVFSTYIKGLDEKPQPSLWGSKLPFQTLVGDFTTNTGAWVHGVAFEAQAADALAFVTHDGSLSVVVPGGEGQPPLLFVTVKTRHLPFKLVLFAGSTIVAAGHNCTLAVFSGSGDSWVEKQPVEKQKTVHSAAQEDEEISSHDALNMFKQMDLQGRVDRLQKTARALDSVHQNTITVIRWHGARVSSSGIDGKVVVFDV